MAPSHLAGIVVTNEPVAASLLNALGNTLMLAVPAAVLGFTLRTILGALAALYHGTILDRVTRPPRSPA